MKLLICYTPLHALIAERLVELGELEDFYLLYICFNRSRQHEFYYERLAAVATRGSDFLLLPHDWRDPIVLLHWRISHFDIRPIYLFCGNIKHAHSRWLAFLFGVVKFRTFDDGSGNIVESGYFSELHEVRLTQRLFSIISPKYLYRNIVRQIEMHFSIYRDQNVYSKFGVAVIRISLFDDTDLPMSVGNGVATVYLGHALVETSLATPEEAGRFDCGVFNEYTLDYFLPHPRSRNFSFYEPLRQRVTQTSLVAEEFVLSLLENFNVVRVIGLNSSALLNLNFSKRIELINIKIGDGIYDDLRSIPMKCGRVEGVCEAEIISNDEKDHI
jgi:beta-galactosamide-alpha-2,3-sialyltransferase